MKKKKEGAKTKYQEIKVTEETTGVLHGRRERDELVRSVKVEAMEEKGEKSNMEADD